MANDDRQRQRVLDDHAHAVLGRVFSGDDTLTLVPAGALGGRPTVDIQGPDGEWRRYYVRLTEVRA